MRLTPLLLTWKKRGKKEKKRGQIEPGAAPIAPSTPPDSNTPKKPAQKTSNVLRHSTHGRALMLLMLLLLLLLFPS